MACTRQGAEVWPCIRRGQSLRRALQVKPRVRQTKGVRQRRERAILE